MHSVYIIACFNDNEYFIKIGKTFNSINKRFAGNKKMPYNFVLLQNYTFDTSLSCSLFEKKLHKKYKNSSYKPSIKFEGYTECFLTKVLDYVL